MEAIQFIGSLHSVILASSAVIAEKRLREKYDVTWWKSNKVTQQISGKMKCNFDCSCLNPGCFCLFLPVLTHLMGSSYVPW